MNTRLGNIGRVHVAMIAFAILATLTAAVSLAQPQQETSQPSAAATRSVVHVSSDHAVYPTLGDLTFSSDAIIVGTVGSSTVDPGESPGTDSIGDPITPVPHTNYNIAINSTIKGGLASGGHLLVSVAGGQTATDDFVLDGVPELVMGNTYMFFLQLGDDGKYYPLAAGSAVAPRDAEGKFVMSAETTGGAALVFTANDVTAGTTPPPSGNSAKSPLTITVARLKNLPLRKTLRRGIRPKVSCSRSCDLVARATITRALAKKLKFGSSGKTVLVARGDATPGGTLIVRFTKSAKRRLARARSVRLTLTVEARDAGGATTRTSRKLKLSR